MVAYAESITYLTNFFFRTACLMLPKLFSLKLFKVIATLTRYLILGYTNTCTWNLESYEIFDKIKPRLHASNVPQQNDTKKKSVSVTFELWGNRKGKTVC